MPSSSLFVVAVGGPAEEGVDRDALCRALLTRVIEEPFAEVEAEGDVRPSLDALLTSDWTDGGREILADVVKTMESLFELVGLIAAGVAPTEARVILRLYCHVTLDTYESVDKEAVTDHLHLLLLRVKGNV